MVSICWTHIIIGVQTKRADGTICKTALTGGQFGSHLCPSFSQMRCYLSFLLVQLGLE